MKTSIVLIGLFSGLLFGIATPISKIILEELNSFQLAGLLYLGAALAFIPFITNFATHGHPHYHKKLVHIHQHSHDDGHHNHIFENDNDKSQKYSHLHEHKGTEHTHKHYPDLHHRHEH